MLFNSYGFLFLFLPLALVGFGICKWLGRKLWGEADKGRLGILFLLGASFVFYGWNRPAYLPVLVCSMAVNYGLSWQMERTPHKKQTLAAGVLFNVGALACFKYLGTGDFVPLGVSFFTFTQIAFLMECYRGSLKGVKALPYGLYVSFFPKIMQGPIALPEEMLPQFENVPQKADWERIFRCLYLFIIGLFKKVLIADTLGKGVDFGYANLAALNAGDGLIVMLSYTLQLYFDFSGYCDMAMGIAGLFGFDLPLNFDSPYKASNIMEFWKGWHITLTRFFTKYLYIPLGGNRKGKGRTYLNCLMVFLVSGIWHGSGLQFVVWGMMHGILFVVTRAWKDRRREKGKEKSGENKIVRGICVLLTFLYVNGAWIFFRAPSVQEGLALFGKIFSGGFGRINWELAGCYNLDEFWYVIKVLGVDRLPCAHYILMFLFLALLLLVVFFGQNAVNIAKKAKPGVWNILIMTILLVWSVLSFSGVSSFLYVNF